MTQMLYKPGGNTKVWGKLAHVKIVEVDEIERHIEDGWLTDPSMLFTPTEPEPEPEPDVTTPKKTRKKAVTNEPNDQG